jgi:hypothetical protein
MSNLNFRRIFLKRTIIENRTILLKKIVKLEWQNSRMGIFLVEQPQREQNDYLLLSLLAKQFYSF